MSARTGGETLPGRQAYGVLTWVYENPLDRAAEGVTRVAELARQATGAALGEVQDVGKMLARLLGTYAPETGPAPEFAGIASQVIELRFNPDQPRGLHGEWIGSGLAGAGSRVVSAADRQAQEVAYAHRMVREGTTVVPHELEGVMKAHAAVAAQEMAGTLRAEHALDIHKMIDRVSDANKALETHQSDMDSQSKKDARSKLAIEGGMALLGAAIASGLATAGVAPLIAILAALGPILTQIIVEFFKRL